MNQRSEQPRFARRRAIAATAVTTAVATLMAGGPANLVGTLERAAAISPEPGCIDLPIPEGEVSIVIGQLDNRGGGPEGQMSIASGTSRDVIPWRGDQSGQIIQPQDRLVIPHVGAAACAASDGHVVTAAQLVKFMHGQQQ